MNYAPDLAEVHDQGFDFFARGAAPGVLRLLRRTAVRDGLVVDLGCGGGIWARELLDAGYEVHGVDISPAMLAIARSRAPAATFVQASLFDAELPPCAAVTSIGECIGYIQGDRAETGQRGNPPELATLFGKVLAALRPGGLFVFDLAAPGRERPRARRTWFEGEGWMLCLEAWEESQRRLLTREITVFRELDEGGWRRSHERHVLRLHPRDEVLAALAAAGFGARALRGYGRELRFPRGLVGYAARKPA